MDIRHAQPADRVDVVALWHACGLTTPWNDPHADFDRALHGATSTVLVGLVDDAIVASAMVGHDGHRGWLYYVAVSPQHQRRGFGAAVVAAAEAWLRDTGAVKVQLMVRTSNAPVTAFYNKLGYEPSDVTVLARWL